MKKTWKNYSVIPWQNRCRVMIITTSLSERHLALNLDTTRLWIVERDLTRSVIFPCIYCMLWYLISKHQIMVVNQLQQWRQVGYRVQILTKTPVHTQHTHETSITWRPLIHQICTHPSLMATEYCPGNYHISGPQIIFIDDLCIYIFHEQIELNGDIHWSQECQFPCNDLLKLALVICSTHRTATNNYRAMYHMAAVITVDHQCHLRWKLNLVEPRSGKR